MNKSPIFLKPIIQERIWGGRSLEQFGYELSSSNVGECWGISAHPNGQSIVLNGIFKGMTLGSLWESYPDLFGNHPSKVFPLLAKILDANEDLSVQVHPDDFYANEVENGELGKSECWYILDCGENAEIVYGHYAKTKEEFKELMLNNDWNSLLRRKKIKPGDFIYVPSGTVHALCSGTLVLEIQQSSDTTYRLYDYDRIDNHGNKRILHIDKAIEVANIPHQDFENVKVEKEIEGAKITTFIRGKYFTVFKLEIISEVLYCQDNIFKLVNVIDGHAVLKTSRKTYSIKKGDHFIVPSNLGDISIKGKVELVVSHL